VRADGSIVRLDCGGPVLGVLPHAGYEQAEVALAPGDRIVLFTDGLTEAPSGAGEEFGEARLLDAAVRHRLCSAPALQARLGGEVLAFTGGCLQDDATLIVAASEL
jgi:sigma-B regulation protein RsbU (phosphoserine phosphatase)